MWLVKEGGEGVVCAPTCVLSVKIACAKRVHGWHGRSIPGPLQGLNKHAIDWGRRGVVAYGCHNTIAVVDPINAQIIQMLCNGHTAAVTQCVFQSCSPAAQPGIRLVSGDSDGRVMVWDVVRGKILFEMTDPLVKCQGRHVVSLAWLPCENSVGGEEGVVVSLHASKAHIKAHTKAHIIPSQTLFTKWCHAS